MQRRDARRAARKAATEFFDVDEQELDALRSDELFSATAYLWQNARIYGSSQTEAERQLEQTADDLEATLHSRAAVVLERDEPIAQPDGGSVVSAVADRMVARDEPEDAMTSTDWNALRNHSVNPLAGDEQEGQ